MLSEIEFFVVFFTKTLYAIGRDLFMLEFDGFRLLQQLYIPALTGGIGGLSLMVMASLSNYGEFSLKDSYRIYIKLALLGGIAGIAAVNLLNPDGNISQVMVLGLIAGLSGFSYLKRNSLVDSIHEDSVLKGIKDATSKEVEEFFDEDQMKVENEEVIYQEELEDDVELDSYEPRWNEVEEYIKKRMDEWEELYPDGTFEEYESYYEEVVGEVYTNPKIIELEK